MPSFKIHKVTAVPLDFEANEVYFVGAPSNGDLLEIYVANSAGDALKRMMTTSDVAAQISAAIDARGSTVVVADIAERDALDIRGEVIVVDATDDPTVDSGGAKYYASTSGSEWVKLSETESMDVVLAWSAITGGPSSTSSQIDTAVLASHTHVNKSQLNKIDQDDDGNLTYNGELPATGWTQEDW